MAEKKRRGLGSGLGALIPDSQKERTDRPIDVFFGKKDKGESAAPSDEGKGATKPSGGESVAKPSEGGSVAKPSEGGSTAKVGASVGATKTRKGASAAATSRQVAGKAGGGSGKSATRPGTAQPDGGKVVTRSDEESGAATDGPVFAANAERLVSVPGATFAEIPLNMIVANHAQPRSVFDEDDLNELAQSIAEVGVLQPIVVRPLDEPIPDNPDARYELIMGERRWRASQRAKLEAIPAIVRRTADDDMLRDALLENLHRIQLNPLEEAAAYQQLIDDFGYTQEELSKRVARSRPQISNTLRLMKLPSLVQRRVAAGVLSAGHARALLGLDDPAAMEHLAQRIVAEGLSVRQTEEIVAMTTDPTPAPVRRRRAKRFAPELGALASRLGERLSTKVAVSMGARKGSIKVDFANLEDLNRILEILAPGEGVAPADEAESAGETERGE